MIIMAMRDKIKGRAGKIFMWVVFLAFFGGLGLSKIILNLIVDTDSVVIVNKVPVSHSMFSMRVKQEEQKVAAYQHKYGKAADTVMRIMGVDADPYNAAVESLTYQAVLESFSRRAGVYLAPDYEMVKMNDPYFLRNVMRQYFPTEDAQNAMAFLHMLKNSPQFSKFEEFLKSDMKNDFALSMVRSGLFIPSFAFDQGYKEVASRKKFGVQKFSAAFFEQQARVKGATPEQLRSFFDAQNAESKRYWIQEKRSATQWTFNARDYGITVTESEIADFYAKNKATRFIDNKAQVKVRELVLNLPKGTAPDAVLQQARALQQEAAQNPSGFADMIKKHSAKKDKDGVVDFFAKGSGLDAEYEKAAFRLKEDGQVSPAIQLQDKVVILQRIARKDATHKTLAKVKDDIIRLLIEQKFKLIFAKDVSPLIHGGNPEQLEAFVKQHNGSKAELPLQVKAEEPALTEQKMFSIRREGALAGFMDGSKAVILKVNTIERPQPAVFKDVKNQVATDYYRQEGLKALENALKEAKTVALKNNKLVPVTGSVISTTEWLSTDNTQKISELSSKEGYPQEFMALDWIGGVVTNQTKDGGVLLMLDGIDELKKPSAEQKKQVAGSVYKHQHGLFTHGFIASLYRDATIKVNEELARTIERQQ